MQLTQLRVSACGCAKAPPISANSRSIIVFCDLNLARQATQLLPSIRTLPAHGVMPSEFVIQRDMNEGLRGKRASARPGPEQRCEEKIDQTHIMPTTPAPQECIHGRRNCDNCAASGTLAQCRQCGTIGRQASLTSQCFREHSGTPYPTYASPCLPLLADRKGEGEKMMFGWKGRGRGGGG